MAKFTLRDLNASITQLRTAEQIRQDTASQVAIAHSKKLHGGLGALGRWAAGGGNPQGEVKTPEEELEDARQNTIKVYRENVLWYLGRKLEEAGEQQRSMMEIRLEREVERSKSSLSKSRGFVGARGVNGESEGVNGMEGGSHADRGSTMNGGVDTMPAAAGHKRGLSKEARKAAAIEDEERETIESNLSPEQLQLFEQENSEMLKHYEDTLDQVRYVFTTFPHPHQSPPFLPPMLTHNSTEQPKNPSSKSPLSKQRSSKTSPPNPNTSTN